MIGDTLSAEAERLIEELAALLRPMGPTPIEARIMALLMISPEPLTLDRIVALLNVSKSSASVATRQLERHGAALRLPERGTKRVRYGIADRAAGFLTAQVEFLGAMGQLLGRWADSSTDRAIAPRLRESGSFYLRVRDALDQALKGS